MSKGPKDETRIESGGENVFADLGLPSSEKDMFKVHIALAIQQTIRKRALTQVEAARIMKVDQPKVSAIMRGRLDGIGAERLISWLLDLGRDLEIRVPDKISNRGTIRMRA